MVEQALGASSQEKIGRRGTRSNGELSQLKRMLKIINECNRALVRATNENTLLSEICTILVDQGGYPLAWVGYPEKTDPYRVIPAAAVGPQVYYLNDILITWVDDEYGRGPVGTSIRSGHPVVYNDVAADPAFDPWHDRANQAGLASMIALPLHDNDQSAVLGSLVIYSAIKDSFPQQEIDLLKGLAENLAFGILSLREKALHQQAESDLAEQKLLLVTLMDFMPTTIYIKDDKSRFLLANQAILNLMQAARPEDLLHKSDFDFYPPDLAQKYYDDEQEIIRTGNPLVNFVEPVNSPDGVSRWFITNKIPFKDQYNKIKGIVGIGQDITHLKNMEEDLQKAHDELEERVEKRTLELSKANQQLKGLYQIGQAITAPLQLDVVLNEIAHRTAELIGSDTGVILLLDENGETLSIRGAYGLNDEVVKGTHDRIGESIAGRVVQTGQPIIANNLPDDPRFNNPAAVHDHLLACLSVPLIFKGRAIGTIDVHSKTNANAFSQDDIHLLSMLAGQAAIAIENARLYGQLQQVRDELENRVENRTADLLRINSMLQIEINERKRAEDGFRTLNQELEKRVTDRTARLQESETFFRSLFEGSPDGIFIIDPNSEDVSWKIVDANPGACIMNGYTREELIGQSIDIVNSSLELDSNRRPTQIKRFRQDGMIRMRVTHRRKDGTLFPLDSASVLINIGGRELVMGFDREVTEQVAAENALLMAHEELEHRVEERTAELANTNASLVNEINERTLVEKALQESEETFKRIINTASEGVWVIGVDGVTIFVNARMAEMVGCSIDEMIDSKFINYILEEDLPEYHLRMVRRANGLSDRYERRLRCKNGKIIWTLTSATPMLDEAGHFQGSMAMFVDISAQKKDEKVREILYQISQAAITVSKLGDLFYSIHQSLAELMPIENMFIALYDAANDLFHFPYYVDQKDPQPSPEKPGLGMTGYVLRSGKVLLVDREECEEMVARGDVILGGTLPVDWLGIPLKVETRKIGVLVIQSYNESIRYSEEEKSIMEFVSIPIAMAIERKQSEDALRRKFEELTVLHQLATTGVKAISENSLIEQATQIIASTLSVDNCGILLLDENDGTLYHTPSYIGLNEEQMQMVRQVEKGIIGNVFTHGQSWRVPEVHLEPNYLIIDPRIHSELCVPLKVGDRVLGVINAESRYVDAFSATDVSLLETIANQLSTAIEKFRLYDETRRQLQRLNALHTIDIAITSSMELPFTLGVLLDQGISLLGMDAGDVLLLDLNAQSMDLVVSRGFRAENQQRRKLRLSGRFSTRIVLDRNPIFIPNLDKSDETYADDLQMRDEGFKAYFGVPILAKGQVKGVLEMFSRNPVKSRPEWSDFLAALAAQAAIAIDNTSLFDALQRTNQELTVAYDATLEGWTRSLKLRDEDTENHSQQVTDLTMILAKLMGIGADQMVNLRRGALLHDIGKIGIPDRILLKPGKLTEEEWVLMRKHPRYAYELLSPILYLRPVLEIPYSHHEKWDGSGYPQGLKGEQIPLAARIFAVVDVWQALTSDRPYRPAWTREEALEYIRTQSGQHFDPQVAEAFLKWIEENNQGY
jgi:PAS domain S-box-containing protein